MELSVAIDQWIISCIQTPPHCYSDSCNSISTSSVNSEFSLRMFSDMFSVCRWTEKSGKFIVYLFCFSPLFRKCFFFLITCSVTKDPDASPRLVTEFPARCLFYQHHLVFVPFQVCVRYNKASRLAGHNKWEFYLFIYLFKGLLHGDSCFLLITFAGLLLNLGWEKKRCENVEITTPTVGPANRAKSLTRWRVIISLELWRPGL